MLHIFVDADACPVKPEIYRVAERYGLPVTLVAASSMRVPAGERVALQVVSDYFNAADDWIVEHAGVDDIVITTDVILAARCVEKGAVTLGPTGRRFTDANIGDALASRELQAGLRETGELTGGPPPFSKRDRSRFLEQLDQAVNAIRRKYA